MTEQPPRAQGAAPAQKTASVLHSDRLQLLVALLAVAATYGWLTPPHVLGGDSAEFATLAATGGVAHPPGYPLYVLYLRAFSWLPAASPAHAAGLATALLGVLAVGLLAWAGRRWGLSPCAATLSAAAFGLSPLALEWHTRPEVFALNNVFAASILAASAPTASFTGARRAIVLGFLGGLALAHHQSCALLAPVGLFGVIDALRGARHPVRVAALALGAFVVGILPYGAILWLARTGDGAWVWGDPTHLGDLVDLFLRKDYGTFQLVEQSDAESSWLGQELTLARTTATGGYLVFAVLGAWGLWEAALGRGAASSRPPQVRTGWRLVALSWLLTGPGFVSLFNVRPEGIGLELVQKQHLVSFVPFFLLVGVGLDLAVQRLRGAEGPGRAAGWVGLCVLVALVLGIAIPGLRDSTSPAVDRYLKNTFESLPPNAVLLGTGDHRNFGALYVQGALGLRPDVLYVDVGALKFEWYRRRLEHTLGESPFREGAGPIMVQLAELVFRRGRPLFLTHAFRDDLLAAYPGLPYGTCIQLMPGDANLPDPVGLSDLNDALYERFDLDYAFPTRAGTRAAGVHENYAQTWFALAGVFGAMKDEPHRVHALEQVRRFAPWFEKKFAQR